MIKAARWLIPEQPAHEIDVLAGVLKVAVPAARVLWNRGYRDAEQATRFLWPAAESLHDPGLLKDMAKATERLVRAVHDSETILLYGDYDVDGSTSIVILKKAIELAGGKAVFHVPDRLGEGYGMRPEVIEQAAANHVTLVISVDTGIRAIAPVERASELGIDVIITDHHLPEAHLPPALAIINPNRSDCTYPEKNLCGAGVALKLVQSLFGAIGWPEEKALRMTESFLKMVSIATVADVVPLTGENRFIVKRGLDGLRRVRNPGLRALLDAAGFKDGERPTAGQVAFRIAPRINAAGRMANATEVVELFLTADNIRARRIAGELHEWNQERQQREAGIVREILGQCLKAPVTDEQAALVFAGEGWHRGVVGIVASRLVERFHRPVFVLSIDSEQAEAQGSGRSVPAFHLLDSLESMAGLLHRFGGHRQAAGLTLSAARVSEFREAMNECACSRLTPDDFRAVREFDAAIEFSEISDTTAGDVLSMEPFGFGNPAPLFFAGGATVDATPRIFKEKHVRVPVRQNGRLFWFKGWNMAEKMGAFPPGTSVDLAFSFEDDAYSAARGYAPWGLVLKDIRAAG